MSENLTAFTENYYSKVHEEHHLWLEQDVKNGGNFIMMYHISQNVRICVISIKLVRIQLNFQ